jgi:hypothetical protein
MIRKFRLLLFLLLPCIALFGQVAVGGDTYKQELLKSVAPENPKFLQQPKISNETLPVTDNQILKAYDNYKYKSANRLMDLFKDKYKISPNITLFKGSIPLNMRPAGSTETVFMGGHHVQVPTGGTLVVPSGNSLSGGIRKKLSPKTKDILINVLGMDIEE